MRAAALPAPGWTDRVGLHQLFPLLVHAVLFGQRLRRAGVVGGARGPGRVTPTRVARDGAVRVGRAGGGPAPGGGTFWSAPGRVGFGRVATSSCAFSSCSAVLVGQSGASAGGRRRSVRHDHHLGHPSYVHRT
ncbi:hypothetical protein ACRAWF_16895 [Streptomyces sp. L7]